jgi:DNA ligase-1
MANMLRRQWLRQMTVSGLGAWLGLALRGPAQAADPPPDLLLARETAPTIDPTPYLVSEKFDGVRALWDGRQLRSRSGHVYAAPAWFTAHLPADQPLDGELWLDRGRFEALSGMVRKAQPQDADWQQIRYLVFELPGAPGPFEQRAAQLRALVAARAWPGLQAVEQTRLPDAAALQQRLQQVVAAGGEGLALHRADAPYETGRSGSLLKLKPQSDAEAVVLQHLAGKGRLVGKMGALQVQAPDGRRFVIGTGFSDAVRSHPPAVGSTVTYRYRGLTDKGLPRFASYLRTQDPDL